MQATNEMQVRLLSLAEIDQHRIQCRHRAKQLAEHQQIADAVSQLEQSQPVFEALVGDVEAAKSEITRIDDEVSSLRERIARDNERLNLGGLSKDLLALQHEIETLNQRVSDFEDLELDAMESLEKVLHDHDELLAQRSSIQDSQRAFESARDEHVTQARADFARETESRHALAATIVPQLLALYDRVAQNIGTGAALLRAKRCEGCRMDLDPHTIVMVKAMADDQVFQCESCDRILVRTELSGLS